MINSEDANKLEKKLRKVKIVLDFIFLLLMIFLLDLFANLWSMNKLWMQLIFVAIFSIIWSKGAELILSAIQNRIVNKTENE
ncbi:MAG: hypothetical protein LIP12_01435 [Clostridiales bacterium]|nr:hypothetical protein [Clostridiales bacterium]